MGLRTRSRVLTIGWATVIAVVNAAAHRRATRKFVRRGKVVVCDRYTLDSEVQLRSDFGATHALSVQRWLVRVLSPAPLRGYLLDVSPKTALRRKGEFSLDALQRRASLYRAEHGRLGVARLDGERPADELSAEVAQDVWQALT